MKKLLFLCFMLFMISCNSEKREMQKSVVKFMEENAKDPKSYESVELTVLDTVTIAEVAKEYLKVFESNKKYQDSVIINFTHNKENNILFNPKSWKNTSIKDWFYINDDIMTIDEIKQEQTKFLSELEKAKNDIKKYDLEIPKLKNLITDNSNIGYLVYHKYRIKNGFGALDLSENYICFDNKYNIINFSNENNTYPIRLLFEKITSIKF